MPLAEVLSALAYSQMNTLDQPEEQNHHDHGREQRATKYSHLCETMAPVIKYHLLKNPQVGGRPMIEKPPTKKPVMVRGIFEKDHANRRNEWFCIFAGSNRLREKDTESCMHH